MIQTSGSASFLAASGAALAGELATSTAVANASVEATSLFSMASAFSTQDTYAGSFASPFFANGGAANGSAKASPNEILGADMSVAANRDRAMTLFKHKDLSVRLRTVDLMGKLREEGATRHLFDKAICDPETIVRMRAVKSLERVGSEASAHFLARIALYSQCERTAMTAQEACRFLCDASSALKAVIQHMLISIGSDRAKAMLNYVAR